MLIRALLHKLHGTDRLMRALSRMLHADSSKWPTFEEFHARWLALKTWAMCEQRPDGMSMQEFYGGGELAAALPAEWEIDTSRIDATTAMDPVGLKAGTTVELGLTYELPPSCPGTDLLRVLPLTDGSLVYEVTQCKFYDDAGTNMTSCLDNTTTLLASLREDKRVPLPKLGKGKLAHDLLVMAGTFPVGDTSKIHPNLPVLVAGRNSLRELYGDTFWGAAQFYARNSPRQADGGSASGAGSRTFCTMAFSGARPPVHNDLTTMAAVLRRAPRGVPAPAPAPAGIARSLAMGALRVVRLVR